MASVLRAAGLYVEVHDDHFAQDAPDSEWLAAVGRNNWIVITRDERIRYRAAGFFRALQNRNKNGDEFVAFIRSAPASLSATLAALPCMSLIPVAPFLPEG